MENNQDKELKKILDEEQEKKTKEWFIRKTDYTNWCPFQEGRCLRVCIFYDKETSNCLLRLLCKKVLNKEV